MRKQFRPLTPSMRTGKKSQQTAVLSAKLVASQVVCFQLCCSLVFRMENSEKLLLSSSSSSSGSSEQVDPDFDDSYYPEAELKGVATADYIPIEKEEILIHKGRWLVGNAGVLVASPCKVVIWDKRCQMCRQRSSHILAVSVTPSYCGAVFRFQSGCTPHWSGNI